jgi:NADH-quinone oxidoreductase subunit N
MQEILHHILESSKSLKAEGILTFSIAVITLLISFGKRTKVFGNVAWSIALTAVCLSGILLFTKSDVTGSSYFFELLKTDGLYQFGGLLVVVASVIVFIHLKVLDYDFDSEAYLLILGIVLGLLLLLKASHFLSFFIALEFVSLCSYMLVAFRKEAKNLEAGIKYLIFGATATALMLYGVSLIYGLTGKLDFESVTAILPHLGLQSNHLEIVLALILAGPLFKLSAAPFHIWAPDVYEATPTPLLSFLAIAPKIGGLIAVYRILSLSPTDHSILLGTIILLSILIGNFAALTQTNSKRMMGYSGIAQAGFILIGLIGVNQSGIQASAFYLATYVFISTGTFFFLDLVAKQTRSHSFESMAGMSRKSAVLSITGLLFMVALVGLPPTSGFTAKFLVFSHVWKEYTSRGPDLLLWIMVFGLLNTAISLYYYFKVPYQMFVKKPAETGSDTSTLLPVTISQIAFLTLLGIAVVLFFFAPEIIQILSKNI